MPWTFAHPAAVLPLKGLSPRWLSLPGLVLGSLAPDFGYYVGLQGMAAFAHRPLGIVACCLPAALLLLALLHRFARPLTVLLPQPHRQFIRHALAPQHHRFTFVSLFIAAVSVAIGAGSHVLWDAFTHADRWGVALLPMLDRPLFAAGDRQIRVFNVLQHFSTAIGLAAIALVYVRSLRAWSPQQPQSAHQDQTPRLRLLLACTALSVLLGAAVALLATPASQSAYLSAIVVRTVICSTTVLLFGFAMLSLQWWRKHGEA